MNTINPLFPNKKDCYLALFQDAVYKHDDNNYEFTDDGEFKRRDRVTVIQQIMQVERFESTSFNDAENNALDEDMQYI
jgi:hypothetical protein